MKYLPWQKNALDLPGHLLNISQPFSRYTSMILPYCLIDIIPCVCACLSVFAGENRGVCSSQHPAQMA